MAQSRRESFVISIKDIGNETQEAPPVRRRGIRRVPQHQEGTASFHRLQGKPRNFSSMKLLDRFRKLLVNFLFFSIPPPKPQTGNKSRNSRNKDYSQCHERSDPPKTSCSSYSYYSSSSHQDEAIADCIEFCNRSSEDQLAASSCGSKLSDDVMV